MASLDATRTEFARWTDEYVYHGLDELDAAAAKYVHAMLKTAILCAAELLQRPSEASVIEIFRKMMDCADTPTEVPIRRHSR